MEVLCKGVQRGNTMEKRIRKSGSAMLEVMMISILFLIISVSLLTLSSAVMGRAVRQKEKNEAYYAAVAAVRMMEGELLKEGRISEAADALEKGMDRTPGTIKICTQEYTVQVPVWIASEKTDEGRLVLKAEAMVGEQKGTAYLTLDMPQKEEYAAKAWEKSEEK